MHHQDASNLDSPAQEGSGHETTDIKVKPLLLFVVGLFGALLLVMLVLRGQFSFYERNQSPGQATPGPLPELQDAATAEPRIQAAPVLDMDVLRARENAELSSMGWVDRAKGVAKIPIDDAMKILVEKGLPARKSTAASTPAAPKEAAAPNEAPREAPKDAAKKGGH